MSDDFLQRLRRLDCCAVSDALDKLGIVDCVVSSLKQQSTSDRIAGRVVTCRLIEASKVDATHALPRHLGTSAIEACSPGDVIVVEQRTGMDAACWGGILSLGAKL
jgi:4-hydroxy-4-methyl-2-oxoglutarate aldolase